MVMDVVGDDMVVELVEDDVERKESCRRRRVTHALRGQGH